MNDDLSHHHANFHINSNLRKVIWDETINEKIVTALCFVLCVMFWLCLEKTRVCSIIALAEAKKFSVGITIE